jgi:hypothetical protein
MGYATVKGRGQRSQAASPGCLTRRKELAWRRSEATGTSYPFTGKVIFDQAGSSPFAVTATGTVAVDQQGRVRRFDAAYTEPPQGTGQGLTPRERVTVQMTSSDFGTPVSVSLPPASEVFIPNI